MSRAAGKRSSGAARSRIQAVVKTRELGVRDTGLTGDFEERGLVNAVVASQRVALRELTGVFAERVTHLNNHISRPLGVERALRGGEAGGTQYVLATPSSEDCPCLRIGHRRCGHARCEFHLLPDTLVACFPYVQLYQAAGV